MAEWVAKRAAELSEQDVQHVTWQLLKRVQALEIHLADVASLLLFASADTPTLDEAQYQDLVERLTTYLEQTNRQLQHLLEIEARYRAEHG